MRKLALLVIVGVAFPLCAQTEQKEKQLPWMFDNEERLARRFNDAEAAERREASETCRRTKGQCQGSNVVEGERNPELLSPSELMDNLTRAFALDARAREALREEWLEHSAVTLRCDFWDRLYEVGKPFFEGSNEESRLLQELNGAPAEEKARIRSLLRISHSSICRDRALALAAARGTFGHEIFDAFLYTAVARDMRIVTTAQTPSVIRWIEGGCQ